VTTFVVLLIFFIMTTFLYRKIKMLELRIEKAESQLLKKSREVSKAKVNYGVFGS